MKIVVLFIILVALEQSRGLYSQFRRIKFFISGRVLKCLASENKNKNSF